MKNFPVFTEKGKKCVVLRIIKSEKTLVLGVPIISTHCASKETVPEETDNLPEVTQLVTSKTRTGSPSPAPNPVLVSIYYTAMASSLEHLEPELLIIRIKSTVGRITSLFLNKTKQNKIYLTKYLMLCWYFLFLSSIILGTEIIQIVQNSPTRRPSVETINFSLFLSLFLHLSKLAFNPSIPLLSVTVYPFLYKNENKKPVGIYEPLQ